MIPTAREIAKAICDEKERRASKREYLDSLQMRYNSGAFTYDEYIKRVKEVGGFL